MTLRPHLWFLVLMAAAVVGCAGKSPPVTYYSLTPTTVEPPAPGFGGGPGETTIGIGPITIPDLVNRPQLPRPTPEGVQLEEFHRWGGQLDREMGRALVLQLSQRLGSGHVVPYPWSVPFTPDYQVTVDVLQFSVDTQGQAILDVRWAVLRSQDAQPRIYASVLTRPVADPSPGSRAAALQQTVADLGEAMAVELLRLRGGGS